MIKRNDKRDFTPPELMLVRAGHHLWAALRSARKSGMADEEQALSEALETIWAAKRVLRAEQKASRAEQAERARSYFAERRAA